MKRSFEKMLIGAAVAAASMVAAPAMGQLRAAQDGHAIDASNRVGSGGYNDTVSSGGITQNNIIYGNVTGGIGFSGPLREADPGAFEGPTAGRLFDNFVRTTAGVPTAYQSPTVANAPTAYYGSSRIAAPPIGTERLGTTGAYVGSGLTSSNVDPLLSQVTASLDQQKQASFGESAVLGAGTNLVQQNSTVSSDQLPGNALDATVQPSIYNLSPLFGVNPLPGTEGAADEMGANSLFAQPSQLPGGSGRLRAQNADVARMRSELLQQQNGTTDDQQGQNPNLLSGGLGQNMSEKPLSGSLDGSERLGGTSLSNSASIKNSVNTQQDIQERLTGPVPSRIKNPSARAFQESQNQYKSPQLKQLEAYARSANERAALQAKTAPGGMPTSQPAGGSGLGTPGDRAPSIPSLTPAVPGIAPSPSAPSVPTLPPASSVPPVKVNSIAEGVQAKGLHDLLQSAEELMKQDKFQSAIAKYNTAEDVAPNDALIPLGRANAELGAGYYNQASVDLHEVFQTSPATLMGQYDLSKWMNDKRVDFIVSDLQALAKADTTQEMPEFLLAYLFYNTGRAPEAAEHLERAKERAGGKDPILKELEARWKLPVEGGDAKPPIEPLNK